MYSSEVQVMTLMTMQTINICGVVYIGSKIFHLISVVIKFILREMEKHISIENDSKND